MLSTARCRVRPTSERTRLPASVTRSYTKKAPDAGLPAPNASIYISRTSCHSACAVRMAARKCTAKALQLLAHLLMQVLKRHKRGRKTASVCSRGGFRRTSSVYEDWELAASRRGVSLKLPKRCRRSAWNGAARHVRVGCVCGDEALAQGCAPLLSVQSGAAWRAQKLQHRAAACADEVGDHRLEVSSVWTVFGVDALLGRLPTRGSKAADPSAATAGEGERVWVARIAAPHTTPDLQRPLLRVCAARAARRRHSRQGRG